MKKLLLFLILQLGFISNARFVQINFNEGFSINLLNINPSSPSEGSSTTDTEINSILTSHNIYNCIELFTSSNKVFFVNYSGVNINGLINDLNNNSNVFKVSLCYDSVDINYPTFADVLYIKLISDTNGIPIGINSNGNVITNNEELNVIFETFKVKGMVQLTPNLTQYFEIYFEEDVTELKNALDNFNVVIESSDLIGVPMLLSNSSFEKSNIQISPNPFTTNFNIQSEKIISNYFLFDVFGKQLISTSSKNVIKNFSSQLSSGVYFLNLQFENGQKGSFKLIKN